MMVRMMVRIIGVMDMATDAAMGMDMAMGMSVAERDTIGTGDAVPTALALLILYLFGLNGMVAGWLVTSTDMDTDMDKDANTPNGIRK